MEQIEWAIWGKSRVDSTLGKFSQKQSLHLLFCLSQRISESIHENFVGLFDYFFCKIVLNKRLIKMKRNGTHKVQNK